LKISLEELNLLVEKYNQPNFIELDPISIPHSFKRKEDIEMSGFLTSVIAWGRRDQILKKSNELMRRMDYSPFEFIKNFESSDIQSLEGWLYRTFQTEDLIFFLTRFQEIFSKQQNLEEYFKTFIAPEECHYSGAISRFKEDFFLPQPTHRASKHLPNPLKGSAAKRFHMFLRWMGRKDENGVDFGLWKSLDPQFLSCPLDTHSGRVARAFGLLKRKQNDFKALQELDQTLRKLKPKDPAVFDFALFGAGVDGIL
jgi:uncharacterized protein (TIGR02757 family)